jgi:hypothetical protein
MKSEWIMLIERLPVANAPPKMSIHWSIPWPNEDYAKDQKKRYSREYKYSADSVEDAKYFWNDFGKEPNWISARKIIYSNEHIRVFPHEYSLVGPGKLHEYEEAYNLVPDTYTQEIFMDRNLSKTQRIVFDSALLDGCDEFQAMLVAVGKDPTDEFPPIGWWKLRPEYAQVFGV